MAERSSKGFTFIYDAAIMCMVAFLALALFASAMPYSTPPPANLQGYATSILTWLDSRNLLSSIVYERDAVTLSRILDRLCPGGYRIEVYSTSLELLWSYTSPGFDQARASASQPYPLSGYQGAPNPRLVVLLLSL